VDAGEVLLGLLERAGPLREHAPELASYLGEYPRTAGPVEASFIYWARQEFGYKPVVTAFHVVVLRRPETPGRPTVITVSTQLFATHYIDGGFGISAFEPGAAAGQPAHLGYFNRSTIDLPMMWLLRGLVEDRIEDKAREIFALQLDRLSRAAASPARLTRKAP
jgi:hypothetical protein